MTAQALHLEGKSYVVIPRDEYDRLVTLAKATESHPLPDLPAADAEGNVPAVEYARASLARKIIRQRVALGLNQKELAKRAGIRPEVLCRIETGKHTPAIMTIDRIDRALKRAAGKSAAPTGEARNHHTRRNASR